MPAPSKRQPKSAPPVAVTEPIGGGLAPAPGNGTPFAELGARKPAGSPRRGRQLGLRVPEEVYQRLDQVSTETGISRQRLLVDALSAWLERYED
jgi:hypothetical protein